jgi:hypothetical protein
MTLMISWLAAIAVGAVQFVAALFASDAVQW